jgi:hypothetical protein
MPSQLGRAGPEPLCDQAHRRAQYVAILSGLGGDPSFYYSAPKGGMLWVFAIDGKVDEGGMYNAQVIEKMLPAAKP